MEIANPIYDAVFKYLMEDTRAAKTFISYLTGYEVESLEFKPTEYRVDNVGERNFTICRMDFAAKVKTNEGSKLILIEIQKAKYSTDIMRFRRYLGGQYSNPENCIETTEVINGKEVTRKVAESILTIYFLGHRIEHSNVPVIRVKRSIIDVATNEELEGKSEFIESLTHESVIVQIPALKGHRRSKLEILLSFFDQNLSVDGSKHTLLINDEEIPEEFKFIYRRLAMANAQRELKESMNIEDEILEELNQKERLIAHLGERTKKAEEDKLKEAKARKKAEEEKKRAEEDKLKEAKARKKAEEDKLKEAKARKKAEEEKLKEAKAREKAEEEKLKEAKAREKAEEEIKRAEEEKKKMIELLRAAGITEDEIREKLNND